MEILEIRILPPFAVGRLGSSPSPMDNYRLVVDDGRDVAAAGGAVSDAVGPRKMVPAPTLVVDLVTGEITARIVPERVRMRDDQRRVRPIAPFLELWARFEEQGDLVPLTIGHLEQLGLSPASVSWSAHLGNIKAFRRTGDANDKIEAVVGPFSDHAPHPLLGDCANFKTGKQLPFGALQYLKPTAQFPELRVRFTPAIGVVYGPVAGDPLTADDVYDADKGRWKGYADPDNDPRSTIPAQIYAADPEGNSLGYLDDECDGLVEASVETPRGKLTAFARIAAGPPTFAPDSEPVRTVNDELLQADEGPVIARTVSDDEVRDIVRRALETVRLMNTEVLNRASTQRGVGMARMDILDVNRAAEPIMDPSVVDALAVRARHERVLLALESGTLAWFSRVLREHTQVGDLSDEGRRRMPAMMRGADGRHLALTRRQVGIIRAAADQLVGAAQGRSTSAPGSITSSSTGTSTGTGPAGESSR